ncbi:hypothetical protein C6988_05180 [Nitrosopumilus sp. b1]|uniref:CRISPR-associated protein Cas4 n=1 Tax=Nitrosopumilus sp. b1 TaxID=2109907 RepID=UPI0015F6C697|nr:Dna2/Cas4 domain-containing protein [Nitrosopumilus sp. b1]KAF6243084.1 hypothetical protein C6988_05180 [Nitrosopumilus sp. b1]
MMGDRDYRSFITNAIESISKEIEIKIDSKDFTTIHLHEVVRCLRRSYYDRIDPVAEQRTGFNELTSGLLRKLHYGAESKDFEIDKVKLRGQADMIVDDAIILFRSAEELYENPQSEDILFLNALMWIYNKMDGIIIYITGDRKEVSFSITRNNKMFEEVVRRVRVLTDLLKEKKVPILEPSKNCTSCQYYERCYIKQKLAKQFTIADLVGFNKD